MTRRMIDSSMWSNENFAALPAMARLLQVGMINHADDQGRIKANPLYLAKEIFPYDRVTATNISKWLEQIALNGTIILYAVEGKQYAQLTKWWEYQSLQYAAPSEYPSSPSWKDRIRRTATKGLIVTYNWTLGNGVTVEDTCDKHGKPLAPAPKPKQPQLPPANTNGHSPDYPPEPSPEHSNKLNLIEDQLNLTNGEGDHAREEPPLAPAPKPPPSFRSEILPSEYLPGVPLPSWNREKRDCDAFVGQVGKYGVCPESFRLMVDTVLTVTGKAALAGTSGTKAEQVLNEAKETVVTLLEMNRRTIEEVQAVLASWRENDYRGHSPPTFLQIVEHASAMAAGTHVTTRRQDSGKKEFASMRDYDEWARRNDPEYKRIREGISIKGTTVKRDNYQPVMVH